jgi:hypothetical protein
MPNSFSPKKNNNEFINNSLSFSLSKNTNSNLNNSLSKELVNFESNKKNLNITNISAFNEDSFNEQSIIKNNTQNSTNNESISYTFTEITKKSTNFDKNLFQYLKGDGTSIFNINESLEFNEFLCCKQGNLFIDKTIKNNKNKKNKKKKFNFKFFLLLIFFNLLLIFVFIYKNYTNPKIIKFYQKNYNDFYNDYYNFNYKNYSEIKLMKNKFSL